MTNIYVPNYSQVNKISCDNTLRIEYQNILSIKEKQLTTINLDNLSQNYIKIEKLISKLKNKLQEVKNKIFIELKLLQLNHYKNEYLNIRINKGYINYILKPEIKIDFLKKHSEYFNITKINEHLIIKINKQQGHNNDKIYKSQN